MNLYRNFGTLLETWLTDTISEDDSVEVLPPAPEISTPSKSAMGKESQRTGMLMKSESEDSGLEETPISPQSSEQSFSLARNDDPVESGSPLSLVDLSPSLPIPCKQSQFLVEQALQRVNETITKGRRTNLPPSFTKSRTQSPKFNERSGQPEPPAVPMHIPQPPKNQHCQQDPEPSNEKSENRIQREASQLQLEALTISTPQDEMDSLDCLSPGWPSFGLTYLEPVCRLLEEIARLRARNQELEREKQRFQEQQRKRIQDVTSSPSLHGGGETGSRDPAPNSCGYEFRHLSLKRNTYSDKVPQRSLSDSHLSDWNIGNLMKQQQSESIGNLKVSVEVDKGSQAAAQKEKTTHQTSTLKRTIWKKKEKQKKGSDSQETSSCEEKTSSQRLGRLFKKKSLKTP